MKKEKQQIVRALIGEYVVNRFYPQIEADVQQWLIDPAHRTPKEEALQIRWEEMEVPEVSARKSYRAVLRKLETIGEGVKQSPLRMADGRKRIVLRAAAVIVPLLALGAAALFRWTSADTPRIAYSVPWGERGQLELPDGSRLWVNAGSTVTYPEKFAREKREIALDGEAYFDVAKDTDRPFVVWAQELSVEVTGTEFNVRAFAGQEQLAVTVAQGSVAVTTPDRKVHPLEPDNRLTFDTRTGQAVVSNTDAASLAGWRTGKLVFDAQSFDEIIGHLQMYYAIPFRIEAPLRISGRYTIHFDEGTNIDDALEVITCLVGGFRYDISPQEVKIYAQ